MADQTGTLLLQPFYGSLDYVRDKPGEPVPEGTFCHLLDFLVQTEDNTGRCTNNLDGPYSPGGANSTRIGNSQWYV